MANLPPQLHMLPPTVVWREDNPLDLEAHKEGVMETDKARVAIVEAEVVAADHHQVA